MMLAACLVCLSLAALPPRVVEAEALAERARQAVARDPAAALELGRRALATTNDFVPTEFTRAGKHGEVVEDAFRAAREEYRRHRAPLYEAVGLCLAAAGRPAAATRYLQRAADLYPGRDREALARNLLASGRGWEALDALLADALRRPLSAGAAALAGAAADQLGLPSLQSEMDRLRLDGARVEPRLEHVEGPVELPSRTRLSTGEYFGLREGSGLRLLYLGDAACGTCSADLESIRRVASADVRVVVVPAAQDDGALRRVLALYHYDWPVTVDVGAPEALHVAPPGALVVGRRGFSAGIARTPLAVTLPPLIQALSRGDFVEDLPRKSWNQKPVKRLAPRPRPGMLAVGLAPGEDEPAPASFLTAAQELASGNAGAALAALEALERAGDGWLLPPEARFDRARCLVALGRQREARGLLLRIGDSRFQDEIDRLLESIGGKGE
jgi:tetratricopeptide (TPR) repeat protein